MMDDDDVVKTGPREVEDLIVNPGEIADLFDPATPEFTARRILLSIAMRIAKKVAQPMPGTMLATSCGCFGQMTVESASSVPMSEARFRDSVLRRLSPHFHVEREVAGRHPAGRLRPKAAHVWKNNNVVLGIEFKNALRLRGLADLTGWLAQAPDYSNAEFGRRRIHIFVCPSLIEQVDDDRDPRAGFTLRALIFGQPSRSDAA